MGGDNTPRINIYERVTYYPPTHGPIRRHVCGDVPIRAKAHPSGGAGTGTEPINLPVGQLSGSKPDRPRPADGSFEG